MKNIYILFLLICSSMSHADITDLEQFVNDLNNRKFEVKQVEIPAFEPTSVNYKRLAFINIFSQKRLQGTEALQNPIKNYNSSQLQVVGFMLQDNTSYAFIKTPYETLMVKSGDKISGGQVVKVTSDIVEIDILQTQNNREYHKKIYLKYTNPDNNLKLKL